MANWWDNWSVGGALGAYYSGLGTVAHNFLTGQWGPGSSADVVEQWLQGLGSSSVDTSGQTPEPGGATQTAPGGDSSADALAQFLKSLQGQAGGGGGAASGPSGYTTPDGVFVQDNSPEDRYYKLVDAVWTKIFGFHPDFAQTRVFQQMDIQNTDQLQQVILQMPSHIKAPDGTPINIGTYEDMLTTGNKFAQQYFGRPVPDSLITDWVSQGLTEPAAIQNWFLSHPAKDIPADTYGAIWDAANQWTQKYQGAKI